MPRLRSLPAAAAALALLAWSGCDYWRNLTGSKVPDTSTLRLALVDAWTGEPLSEGGCRLGDDSLQADDSGHVLREAMPTGRHALSCGAPHYYGQAVSVEVMAGRTAAYAAKLARMGEASWYPDRPERAVSFRYYTGSFRFPGRLSLQVTPADTTETIFTYEWSSDRHGHLSSSRSPVYPLATPDLGDSPAEVKLRLKVIANLAGKSYVVGSAEETFQFTRNLVPVFTYNTNPSLKEFEVGCDEYYRLSFNAWDPDGNCKSIFIRGDLPNSSIGLVDLNFDHCPGDTIFDIPYLPFPSPPPGVTRPRRQNRVIVGAVDDDGGVARDTVAFETIPNLLPTIRIVRLDSADRVYARSPVPFRFSATDNGALKSLTVDWDNGGKPQLFIPHDGSSTWNRDINWIWDTSGTYEVVATVRDKCGGEARETFTVEIEENATPRLSVTPLGFDPSSKEYRLQVRVTDEDAALGLDSLSLTVNYGVPGAMDYISKRGPIRETIVGHAYPVPGEGSFYRIVVNVTDLHGGEDHWSMDLPRHQAVGLPSDSVASP